MKFPPGKTLQTVPLVLLFVIVAGFFDRAHSSAARIAGQNQKSVVTVIALDRNQRPLSMGSGFFISGDGDVATNAHVIQTADSVIVRWRGENRKAHKVIRYDERYDLAVLETGHENTPKIPIGDPDAVSPGEVVVALGNPRGSGGTVSNGTLGGIRTINDVSYLQINAPNTPGNSGGPVLNSDGRAIGITTATSTADQNLYFALPINLLEILPRVSMKFKWIKALSFN